MEAYTPVVEVNRSRIELTALILDQKLTATVRVRNPIPETMLNGLWQVALLPNDQEIPWISIRPASFSFNQMLCLIEVDTGRLQANHCYRRHLTLFTNGHPAIHKVTIIVQTAHLEKTLQLPWQSLGSLLVLAGLSTFLGLWGAALLGGTTGYVARLILGTGYAWGALALVGVLGGVWSLALGLTMGSFIGSTVGSIAASVREHTQRRGFQSRFATVLAVSTAVWGTGLGLGTFLALGPGAYAEGLVPWVWAGMAVPALVSLRALIMAVRLRSHALHHYAASAGTRVAPEPDFTGLAD